MCGAQSCMPSFPFWALYSNSKLKFPSVKQSQVCFLQERRPSNLVMNGQCHSEPAMICNMGKWKISLKVKGLTSNHMFAMIKERYIARDLSVNEVGDLSFWLGWSVTVTVFHYMYACTFVELFFGTISQCKLKYQGT